MRLRSTDRYSCQAWTVAAFAAMACLVSMGAIGFGLWLLIYTENFTQVIGVAMRNVFAGYSSLSGFMAVCGILGVCASISRNTSALISFTVLMVAEFICMGGVWIFIFLERQKVSSELMENIRFNPQYYSFLSKEFNNCTLVGGDTEDALMFCRDSIDEWLSVNVWALLAIAALLLVFQLLLLVTSAMLRQMVSDHQDGNQTRLIQVQPNTEPDSDLQQEAWFREVFLPAGSTPSMIPYHHHQDTTRQIHMHRTTIS